MADLEFLTVKQVAAVLKVSAQTVARLFRDLPGVLVIKGPTRNETIRIPMALLTKWIADRSQGLQAGASKSRQSRKKRQ